MSHWSESVLVGSFAAPIKKFKVNGKCNGKFEFLGEVSSSGPSPSYIIQSPCKHFMYCTVETEDETTSKVLSFKCVDFDALEFEFLSMQPSGGGELLTYLLTYLLIHTLAHQCNYSSYLKIVIIYILFTYYFIILNMFFYIFYNHFHFRLIRHLMCIQALHAFYPWMRVTNIYSRATTLAAMLLFSPLSNPQGSYYRCVRKYLLTLHWTPI